MTMCVWVGCVWELTESVHLKLPQNILPSVVPTLRFLFRSVCRKSVASGLEEGVGRAS